MSVSQDASSSTSSSPEPPEPMDLEEIPEAGGGGLEDAVRVAEDEVEELDLRLTARQFAQYLVVDSKQDKQVLDDRIEGVVFRVEEFKSQLEHVQRNMISNAEKVDDLHSHVQQLKDLYTRVDQIQAFVQLVTQRVDSLEEVVAKAERDLEPSKLRKVFTALPKLGKSKAAKKAPTANWQPPQPFRAKEYFTSPT